MVISCNEEQPLNIELPIVFTLFGITIDLSEEQKNNLAKLYQRQIQDLQNDIQAYKMTLQSYKEKIINIKNNI